MKIQKNKGITLIALVITIIILLILAGITIATLTGENGILSKANTAGEESKKKEYEEIFKIIGNGLRADKIINSWNNKTYLDEFEKEIRKEDKLKDAEIIRKNDETIRVITKENYVYEITENEVKSKGVYDGKEPPTLQTGNVTFNLSPTGWTRENVEVEITTTVENYDLEYSLDGSNWKEYTQKIVMTDNGAIYVRLVDAKGVSGGTATKNITNIDREPPTVEFGNYEKSLVVNEHKEIIFTVDDNSKKLEGFINFGAEKQKADLSWRFLGSSGKGNPFNLPETLTKTYGSNEIGTYRMFVEVEDQAGNHIKIYTEPYIVKSRTEIVEDKISGAKNEDGTVDKEKLKEELNKIENIEGVPDTITDESFPVIVKVENEYLEVANDGTVSKAETIDFFKFISNTDVDLNNLGSDIYISELEWYTLQPYWFGGGRGQGTGNINWWVRFPCERWFKGYNKVEVNATFRLNAPIEWDSFGIYQATSQGYINVVKKDGSQAPTYTGVWAYPRGKIHVDPYWGTLSASSSFTPSTTEYLYLGGGGYDPSFKYSECFITALTMKLQ